MAPAPTSTKTLTTAANNGTVIKTSTTTEESLKLTSGNNGTTLGNGLSSLVLTNGRASSSVTLSGGSSGSHEDQKKKHNSIAAVTGDKSKLATKTDNIDEPLQLVWRNVLLFIYLHLAGLYGAWLWVSGQVMWQTFVWGKFTEKTWRELIYFEKFICSPSWFVLLPFPGFVFYCMSGFGITGGAHRYWAHKSFKAKTPLRIILAVMQTVAFQVSPAVLLEYCIG